MGMLEVLQQPNLAQRMARLQRVSATKKRVAVPCVSGRPEDIDNLLDSNLLVRLTVIAHPAPHVRNRTLTGVGVSAHQTALKAPLPSWRMMA